MTPRSAALGAEEDQNVARSFCGGHSEGPAMGLALEKCCFDVFLKLFFWGLSWESLREYG